MWVRLDDGFYDHQKARAAGKDGRELFIAGLCRVAETLSDGFIPDYDLPLIAAKAEVRPKPTAATLVRVGLWETVEGGWLVHDYHDFNPTAEAEREKRRKRAEAGRKGGLRSRPPGRNGTSKVEANASAVASANAQAKGEAESKQIGTPSPSPSPFSSVEVIQSVTSTAYAELDDDDETGRLLVDVATAIGLDDFERAVNDGVDVPSQPHRRAGYLRKCIRNRHENDPDLAEHVRRNAGIGDAQAIAQGFLRGGAVTSPAPLVLVPSITADPDCPYCEGTGTEWLSDEGQGTTRRCACLGEVAS